MLKKYPLTEEEKESLDLDKISECEVESRRLYDNRDITKRLFILDDEINATVKNLSTGKETRINKLSDFPTGTGQTLSAVDLVYIVFSIEGQMVPRRLNRAWKVSDVSTTIGVISLVKAVLAKRSLNTREIALIDYSLPIGEYLKSVNYTPKASSDPSIEESTAPVVKVASPTPTDKLANISNPIQTITINLDFSTGDEISYIEGKETGSDFETHCTNFFTPRDGVEVIVKKQRGSFLSMSALLRGGSPHYDHIIHPSDNLERMLLTGLFSFRDSNVR